MAAPESSAFSDVIQRKSAHYLFHGQTTSLCETCLEPVPAKIIIENESVFYLSAVASTAFRRR